MNVQIKGETFDEARDGARLRHQYDKVVAVMKCHGWITLSYLSQLTGAPEASVSARLRDMRREGYTVERRYVRRGLNEYRLNQEAV